MCIGAEASVRSPLQRLLPLGQSRFIAETPRLVAMPTFGCFVAGYLLVVPRAHVLSFGQPDAETLSEADALIAELVGRIEAAYGLPVLGFEYGINARRVRRIEHAHWHLLPSVADLGCWPAKRLAGEPITSLTELPSAEGSYTAVRGQDASLTVYAVSGPLEADQRIRLRLLVADLDPRINNSADWDWAARNNPELIRQTLTDLGPNTEHSESQR